MRLIPPPNILIVEDDPALAHLLQALLHEHCMDCIIRHSGAQGIDIFRRGDIDLVITDLNMAAGNGVTLIETIRRTSQVPVIIVTGFEHRYTDRLPLLGNITLINKPFDCQDLLDAVETALGSQGESNSSTAGALKHG